MTAEARGLLKRLIPPGIPGRDTRGNLPSYCHVVEDTASGLIFTAGQVALDADGTLVAEDVVGQFEETLRHSDLILQSVGLDRSAIVKVTIFATDVQGFYDGGGMKAFAEYFAGHPPLATLVGVTALARPDLKIEVEFVYSRSAEAPEEES